MEGILRLALQRPVTVMIGIVALMLGCAFSVNRLRMDIFPDLNQPVIYVAQPYGGMDPAQMEGLITNYYEYAFLFMNGIDHVESKNVQNIALVKLYFHPGTNMAQAVAEAAIYANRAKAFFPPGTVTPFIMSLDASMVPVAYVTLSSDTRSVDELADLMLFRVRPKLASLPGTTAPQPFGGSLRSIVVNLNPERLRAYNLSPEKVADALNKGNIITPSGNARVRDQMPIVSVNSIVVNPRDLGNIPIKPEENVYLRDLGTVQDTTDIPTGWALVNGRRAVYMPILKTADASTLTVATQLKSNMDDMRSVLPKDCKLELEFDQSPYVTGGVNGVEQLSLIGALLTGVMVLLFLRDWRAVIVVVLTIPLSLMGALIGLSVTGQTINLMTLGGFSLAIGIIEGTAIVVIENIYTRLATARSVPEAVLLGTAEMIMPVLLSILCILSVFLPSFMMEGAAGSLFVPLSLSVGFAVITAFGLSITFVPVLSIWLLRAPAAGKVARSWFSFATVQWFYSKIVAGLIASALDRRGGIRRRRCCCGRVLWAAPRSGDFPPGRCGPVSNALESSRRNALGGHRRVDKARLRGNQEYARCGQPQDFGSPYRPDGADLYSQCCFPVDERTGSSDYPHLPKQGSEAPNRGGVGTAAQGAARKIAALAL